jgi:putative phage-type endonuclease
MPRLTDAQLEERALGLGATDVAIAAGLDPYTTPFELYLQRIGELDVEATIDQAARDRMERGHRLEDVALEWDRDVSGEAFERVNRTIWHPTVPIIFCHPDARRKPFKTTKRLIEVKTAKWPWKEVPRKTEAQVQVQMACTGAMSVDILVLGFDGPPTRFLVERDDALIHALEKVAVAFWQRLEDRNPPPIDGSSGAAKWLDRTRWANEPEMRASDVQRDLLDSLIATRERIDALEASEDVLVNQIKDTMAGAGRLNAPGIGRVVWTAPTVVRSTKWKEVATAYRQGLLELPADVVSKVVPHVAADVSGDLDVIQGLYTSERTSRTFTVTPEKGDAP